MAEKNIKSRIIHKHDIESNWKLATNFIPMKGEIIVYDIDDKYDYERIKVGDGETLVSNLPFVTDIPYATPSTAGLVKIGSTIDDANVTLYASTVRTPNGHIYADKSVKYFATMDKVTNASVANGTAAVVYAKGTSKIDIAYPAMIFSTTTHSYGNFDGWIVDANGNHYTCIIRSSEVTYTATPFAYGMPQPNDGDNGKLLSVVNGTPAFSTVADIGVATESYVDTQLDALVGDQSVAEQIAAANMIYVGPNRPEDPNIKVWINTAEEGTGIVPVLPRIASITLAADGWTGGSAPYSQHVEINTVTSATKIDLQPTVAQIVSLQNDDIALMAENIEGIVTVYSFGGKPSTDMTMQVQLMEVAYV